jgi:hypothetical protein
MASVGFDVVMGQDLGSESHIDKSVSCCDEDGTDDSSVESNQGEQDEDSTDDSSVESSESECQLIIEELFNEYQEFGHVRDIGEQFNHQVALPYTTAKSLSEVKLVVGWAFLPLRDDTIQPCRDEMMTVIIKMLMWKCGYSHSKAKKYVRNHVLWIDMTPFVLPWNAFRPNRPSSSSNIEEDFYVGRYKRTGKNNDHVTYCKGLLSQTNDSVLASYNKFLSPDNFPSFKAAVILGGQEQVDFFHRITLFSGKLYPRKDRLITHPQVWVCKWTNNEQREGSLAEILSAVATAVDMEEPSPISVEEAKAYIFVTSKPTSEKYAKAALTKRRNKAILDEVRGSIASRIQLDMTQLDIDVGSMSIIDCGDWLLETKKAAEEDAKMKAAEMKAEEKAKVAQEEIDAIARASSDIELARSAYSEQNNNKDAATKMLVAMKQKKKRKV